MLSRFFFFYRALALQFPGRHSLKFISGCTHAVSLRLTSLMITVLWLWSKRVGLGISPPLLKSWKWNDENWNEFELNTFIWPCTFLNSILPWKIQMFYLCSYFLSIIIRWALSRAEVCIQTQKVGPEKSFCLRNVLYIL